MPTRRTTPRTTSKRATQRPAAKKTAKRIMTATHKKALADGRSMSATVDAYLAAINVPKKRGRKVSTAVLEQRLVRARSRAKTATGVDKVLAAQEVRDLQARLAQASATTATDVRSLESAFVKVAGRFSEKRGIRWSAWRDAGVSGEVLKKAGIARTRG
jgi:hypothetical protein